MKYAGCKQDARQGEIKCASADGKMEQETRLNSCIINNTQLRGKTAATGQVQERGDKKTDTRANAEGWQHPWLEEKGAGSFFCILIAMHMLKHGTEVL